MDNRNLNLVNRSRSFLLMVLLATSILISCGVPAETGSQDENYSDVSPRDQDYLARFGVWITIAPYGMVWQPNASRDWQPYEYGHWLWTDQGWSWISYEPYGWLVYHQGNWDYSPDYGWYWVPSEVWSPAAVDWVTYGDNICWAPAPPPGVILPEPWESGGDRYWDVVHVRDFTRENVGTYRIMRHEMVITGATGRAEHAAPNAAWVAKTTRKPLNPVKVELQPSPVGKIVYHKQVLPPVEMKKVESHRGSVEKRVLTTRKIVPAANKKAADTTSVTEKKTGPDKKTRENAGDRQKEPRSGSRQGDN